jgi:heat shock transcription factor
MSNQYGNTPPVAGNNNQYVNWNGMNGMNGVGDQSMFNGLPGNMQSPMGQGGIGGFDPSLGFGIGNGMGGQGQGYAPGNVQAGQMGNMPGTGTANPNTQLARRPMANRQLVTQNRAGFEHGDGNTSWDLTATGAHGLGGFDHLGDAGGNGENESIERLEERAQIAKREAQAKRKQIPPFVQKLNRCVFLFPPNRWSWIRC